MLTAGYGFGNVEIPRGRIIYDGWNSSGTLTAMYKHKSVPGKKFNLKVID